MIKKIDCLLKTIHALIKQLTNVFDKNYGLAHWFQPAPVLPRAVVHTSNPATLTVIRSDDRTGFSVCHRWIEKEQ